MDAPWGATGGQRCAAPARRGAALAEQARSATQGSGAAQDPLLSARLSEGVKTPVILYGGNLAALTLHIILHIILYLYIEYYICNILFPLATATHLASRAYTTPVGTQFCSRPLPPEQLRSACAVVLLLMAAQGRGARRHKQKSNHSAKCGACARGAGTGGCKNTIRARIARETKHIPFERSGFRAARTEQPRSDSEGCHFARIARINSPSQCHPSGGYRGDNCVLPLRMPQSGAQ